MRTTNRVEAMDSVTNLREIFEVLQDEQSRDGQEQLVKEFHRRTFGPGLEISQNQRMALMGSSVILSSQNNTSMQRNRDEVLQ